MLNRPIILRQPIQQKIYVEINFENSCTQHWTLTLILPRKITPISDSARVQWTLQSLYVNPHPVVRGPHGPRSDHNRHFT